MLNWRHRRRVLAQLAALAWTGSLVVISGAGAQEQELAGPAAPVPRCETVPFRVALRVSDVVHRVDETFARVGPGELAGVIASAMRRTQLFLGVDLEEREESPLLLELRIDPLRYRSDPVQPQLEMAVEAWLEWDEGFERFWSGRYRIASDYTEQVAGDRATFRLNLKIAARKLAFAMASDLDAFFHAQGLRKVCFRRDMPDAPVLERVLLVDAEGDLDMVLAPVVRALSDALCLSPLLVPATPIVGAGGDGDVLAAEFDVEVADRAATLAVVATRTVGGTVRLAAVDLGEDRVLGDVEVWPAELAALGRRALGGEPAAPERPVTELAGLVRLLMEAHHARGACRRQAYSVPPGE